MIDKEKIQKAIDKKACMCIDLQCDDCPVYDAPDWANWDCGAKIGGSDIRDIFCGMRPRAIRIMKEWMEAQK